METVWKTGTVDELISAVASKLGKCSFIIYCADDKRFAEISGRLHEAVPTAQMIGTTGFMFSENGSFAEGISAIGFTDNEAEAATGVMLEVDKSPVCYLEGLSEALHKIKSKYKDNVCLEFTTGYEEKIVSTMKICVEKAGVRLIGCTAGNPGEQPKVALNGKTYCNAVAYAVIGSKMGEIRVFKENLYHRKKATHIVTKASADRRTIYEIDGRKAVDVYKEELGYNDENIIAGVLKNPLCLVTGTDNYITAIQSYNKDGSISIYKNMFKNDVISFTEIDSDYKSYMKENMRKVTEGNVAGVISVNCIFRYMFFNQVNYTAEYAGMMNGMANHCHFGMVGNGEQYLGSHINQSMVCIAFMKNGR